MLGLQIELNLLFGFLGIQGRLQIAPGNFGAQCESDALIQFTGFPLMQALPLHLFAAYLNPMCQVYAAGDGQKKGSM